MARDDAASEETPASVSDALPAKRPRRVTPSIITIDSDTPERETRRDGIRHAGEIPDDGETRFNATLRAFLETSAANAWDPGEDASAATTSTRAATTGTLEILRQRVSFVVPVFCRERLKLEALFREVTSRGGYHAVTARKQWRSVCAALGFDLEGQTSASFAMRRNYERTGLFLLEATGGDVAADREAAAAAADAAAAAAARTVPAYRPYNGGPNERKVQTNGITNKPPRWKRTNEKDRDAERDARALRAALPAADVALAETLISSGFKAGGKKHTAKAATDEEEAELARQLNLLTTLDSLSNPVEHAFLFPGINEHDYLVARNHVLRRWRDDPDAYLSVERACSWFRPKFRALVHCAHRFLTTTGLINFGVGFATNYVLTNSGWGATRGAVAVIGAGLAGLQCARQLLAFGHKVIVLEARDRAGGRVFTKKLTGVCSKTGVRIEAVAETGGSIVTGSDGNPLSVIARQLGLRARPIREACPMYLERSNGGAADKKVDDKVFEAYNGPGGALEGVNELRQAMGDAADGVTLGGALERVRREKLKDALDAGAGAENDLWHWHLANLEFANATRLDTLSLGQWDQDDPYEFGGDHEWLPRGNSRVIAALARDVPIFYDVAVKTVETVPGGPSRRDREGRDDGVIVIRDDSDSQQKEEENPSEEESDGYVRVVASDGRVFVADAAVVTVPLGVLKRGDVTFSPPLPARKRAAIENLGFGVLNKVLMLFPFPFWDARDTDTFGYVNACDEGAGGGLRRGRYFMFYSYDGPELSGGATLVALVAGDAALSLETSETDEECVAGVMRVLRDIFSKSRHVPDPADVAVTRWGADPFARGSYSNISPRGTGDDYDALAEPVAETLFFAGEATSRTHPATMHGAFLSGNREAARVHAALKKRGKTAGKQTRGPIPGTGDAWARAPAGKETETVSAFFENDAGRGTGEWRGA